MSHHTKTRRREDAKTRRRTVCKLLDAVLDQEAHEAVHPDHTGVGPSHRRVHAALGARVGVIRGEPGDVGARLGMRCVREKENTYISACLCVEDGVVDYRTRASSSVCNADTYTHGINNGFLKQQQNFNSFLVGLRAFLIPRFLAIIHSTVVLEVISILSFTPHSS
jgi:hypothetical protein